LAKLSNRDFDKVSSVTEEIGDDAFHSAFLLLQLISYLNLSISITWNTSSSKGYLTMDKRRADNFISVFQTINKDNDRITIHLTQDEADPLRKPVHGSGGLQSLIKKLQPKLNNDNTIELTSSDIEKILRYTSNYGSGGFQSRLVGLARALRRIGTSFQAI
jgi:hypothetical protein